ncbi:hypothetical protein DPMN_091875 [Dreissena polymorpha]|uniref:Uncharacterized protein n=1 Tax=Dreissena polymorpha TaxID=45954 RepID=A0A9D4L0A8_DREPO|nr:hypothetical protein DPMN_091875 [Dreissena polymorpha]
MNRIGKVGRGVPMRGCTRGRRAGFNLYDLRGRGFRDRGRGNGPFRTEAFPKNSRSQQKK